MSFNLTYKSLQRKYKVKAIFMIANIETCFWSFHKKSVFSPHVRESRTVLDSGFHAVDSGFRVLDSGFQHSGFRIPKRVGFHFFPVLMLFFALRFRVRILLYWKTLLEGITSLFSFSIYKITGRNALQFRKGLWYNNEGNIGGLSLPQHRRKK